MAQAFLLSDDLNHTTPLYNLSELEHPFWLFHLLLDQKQLGKNKKLAKVKKGLKKLFSEDESKTVYGQQVNNYFSRLLRLNLKRLDAPNKTLVVLNKQLKKQALELSQPSVFDPTTGETAKKDAPVPINYIRVWYGLSYNLIF
jgi:hypothetical protein